MSVTDDLFVLKRCGKVTIISNLKGVKVGHLDTFFSSKRYSKVELLCLLEKYKSCTKDIEKSPKCGLSLPFIANKRSFFVQC